MRDDTLATEAIEWFLKVDREEPSLETLAAWQQWLEQSPGNREEYGATQRTWAKLDSVTRRRKPIWMWAPALAAAAATAFVAIRLGGAGMFHKEIATHIAEHRTLILPDRSRVEIGARTRIDFKFSQQRREVRLLAGEAFFSVAKDATRPFVVDAGVSRVTAVGTAFNVRRYGTSVAVDVAEGRVHLEHARGDLKQGEEAIVGQGGVQTLRTLPARNVAAWRSGRHSYIDEPLSAVIADLNRYATRPVDVEDPKLANLRITTTFFSDDWQGWLATLETAVPGLTVRNTSNRLTISVKSAAAN